MSSSQPNVRSIASRLVLLFTLASAVLVACGLSIFYWLVTRHTFEEDNVALADKVAALRNETKNSGPTKALQMELHSDRAGERSPYWVRVIDPEGRVLAERTGMNERLPPKIFPPSSVVSNVTQPLNHYSGGDLFSLVSTPVQINGAHYLLQVAQDRTSDENFKRQAFFLFLCTLAASIAASAVIARTATRRGLQPLNEMSKAFRRIGPTRLNERVGQITWPRELHPLAEAFDQMLDRLEESFIRLRRFSADLAHELRTPIGNILGEAQVSLTRDRTSGEYREVIESTVAECERLSLIVDNLLFLARAESARQQISPAGFDGRPAVEKIAAFYDAIAEERNVRIDCRGDATVTADPVLFERAIGNLVENALNFTPNGGKVAISLATGNKHSEVTVSDNGCGIAPEHISRVFDRFYRADASRSSRGSGLGLALVKSIVELHGGTAVIQSDVNKGTTVTLLFPNP
ncbi:MAG TPA: heavy metal sensor histidine kinase [Chthoniobacterales bacterium]|jgi:two-component system heavy metal sensor histidine kinase CusS